MIQTVRDYRIHSNLQQSAFLTSFKTVESTSTPQLPFKRPQIPSNRDHKALNRGTLGGAGTTRAVSQSLRLSQRVSPVKGQVFGALRQFLSQVIRVRMSCLVVWSLTLVWDVG